MYDVIILGSGPAGYTAAIYASRAFLKTLLISGSELGGQLTTTTQIENFPGFSQGIDGNKLMEEMKKQAQRFNCSIAIEQVSSIKYQVSEKKPLFNVVTNKAEYQGKSVIIATGASAKYLGIPSEAKFRGKGVSACATCDGFFYKNKEVVVIGGGDTAMEEATFLTRFASKVTIIHRRNEFRASPIMLKRAQDNPKIKFLLNKTVEEVLGDQKVSAAKLKDNQTGIVEEYKTDGFFLAIGHKPNTEFLRGIVALDEKGYVVVKGMPTPENYHTQTTVDGIFAAGDCVDFKYRQAVVAAGMGCMAALDVQKWLETQ